MRLVERAGRRVDVENVDDIIGVAAELKQADEETLTVAELHEVASEIGVSPEYVERAIETLERRRAQEARLTRIRKRARLRNLAIAGAMAVLVVAIGIVLANGLGERAAEVEMRRAQVRNVIDRRARVQARLVGAPKTREVDAELAGADNRVTIETRRYDQAAAAYNAHVSSFPTSWVASLTGAPRRMVLSSEVVRW